jgi:hypothetical protein
LPVTHRIWSLSVRLMFFSLFVDECLCCFFLPRVDRCTP